VSGFPFPFGRLRVAFPLSLREAPADASHTNVDPAKRFRVAGRPGMTKILGTAVWASDKSRLPSPATRPKGRSARRRSASFYYAMGYLTEKEIHRPVVGRRRRAGIRGRALANHRADAPGAGGQARGQGRGAARRASSAPSRFTGPASPWANDGDEVLARLARGDRGFPSKLHRARTLAYDAGLGRRGPATRASPA